MIFYSENLTDRSMKSGVLPWHFQPTEKLTAQLRGDKTERQHWYRNPATRHYFYSVFEGANPNQRVSKDNPPRLMHGFAVDYDLRIPAERVKESIDAMKIKPTWTERSLGGNVRLVWLFNAPLPVETYDFAVFLLQRAIKWLNLDLLPGLDTPAFTDPARLLCNGCDWQVSLGGPVNEKQLQAFFVECGREFRFTPAEANIIPLDIIEKAIKERFPAFVWPVEFAADTQGPSFWIPESATPLSAIVKPDGMFTFSAHAAKPFYSWSEILGPEFVKQFSTESIANATKEIYWDGKRFWRKISGIYTSLDNPELQNYFKVQCRLSPKAGKDGLSLIDLAMDHIYNNNRVAGAAPFLFRSPGVVEFMGSKVLNTYRNNVMKPADELTSWGAEGKFPWLSQLLDALFEPQEQLKYFLAWFRGFYLSGLDSKPVPGQCVFMVGGVGTGKTLTNRAVVGRALGGFADASKFLVGEKSFNSMLFNFPLWCVDDETVSESSQAQVIFAAAIKKFVANQEFEHSKKFEVDVMTEWMGRMLVTLNSDYISSRSLSTLDNSVLDKINVFRCAEISKIQFPERPVIAATIENELPFLLRWMLEWNPETDGIKKHRFGYASFQEKSLLRQAEQSGRAAPFKELLIEVLSGYFQANPEAKEWKGTLTQLVRTIHSDPRNDSVFRSLKLDSAARYMDALQRTGALGCRTENGLHDSRIWIFPRL